MWVATNNEETYLCQKANETIELSMSLIQLFDLSQAKNIVTILSKSFKICHSSVGSFTIGETTVLHLLKVGILEDPSYQGVSRPSLKRLADILCENFDNINASVFMEWAESGHTSSNKATPRGC